MSYNIGTANDENAMTIQGGRTVRLQFISEDGKPTTLTLTNVAYAPDVRFNIISLSYLAEKGSFQGMWNAAGITIVDPNGDLVGKATAYAGLYYAQIIEKPAGHKAKEMEVMALPYGVLPPYLIVAEIDFSDPVLVWHRKLGHLGFANLRKLIQQSTGIDLTDAQVKAKLDFICPVCASTKAVNRIPRDPATRRMKKAGDMMHADASGPYPVPSWDGAFYILALTDDAGRFTWSDRYTYKHELPKVFFRLHKKVER
ncbi:unnamed protein product [Zymoseptoria tritici ST99CH_3D7]|uniref:Uncharacterized protein n=1 Tax=Zymoseptoria tritici (strain ST99CH_3D7) TaxID=1276538 RepID=A0A1X7S9X2_ZYMT9|nr:unnamed protein product [Zymoseptoria tritici ST99CH_3D7]